MEHTLPHLEVGPETVVEGKHMVLYGICRGCAVNENRKKEAGSS
jgi:hypothetical protein